MLFQCLMSCNRFWVFGGLCLPKFGIFWNFFKISLQFCDVCVCVCVCEKRHQLFSQKTFIAYTLYRISSITWSIGGGSICGGSNWRSTVVITVGYRIELKTPPEPNNQTKHITFFILLHNIPTLPKWIFWGNFNFSS